MEKLSKTAPTGSSLQLHPVMQFTRYVQAILPCILTLVPSVAFSQPRSTGENVAATDLGPNLVMFTTSTGNVVASVGPDGALLVGTPSLGSTAQINRMLALRTKSPHRYVVITSEDPDRSEGDAGWQARGAFVAMQENALGRFGGHAMGAPMPLPQRLVQLGVDRPRISFSEVLSFDLNHESIHFIHQPGGSDDAQVLVHFHMANLLYFGEDFPGDGYPRIDVAQGGNLDGILKVLNSWTDSKFQIVPVHGKVMTGSDVDAYCKMLTAVRDRIEKLVQDGKTEEQILGVRPSSDFDSRWGHGSVSPTAFVREIYSAIKANRASANPPHS
jgi:cyclase